MWKETRARKGNRQLHVHVHVNVNEKSTCTNNEIREARMHTWAKCGNFRHREHI